MTEWQLIETAPKDGSTVLLFLPKSAASKIVLGRWSRGDWYEWKGWDAAWPIDVDVTHWMPLPVPPK